MNQPLVKCLLAISVWLCHTNAAAQDATNPIERRSELVVRQTTLNPVILVGNDGRRTELHGDWSINFMEDFLNYLTRERQTSVPPFIIRNVSATGKAIGNFVEVEAQIEIRTSSYQPVRVPLGFKEGILPNEEQTNKTAFQYTGSGYAELIVDPIERQYAAIVIPQSEQNAEPENTERTAKPEINQEHTLSLLLWFPLVQHNGGGQRLSLSFPQANSSLFLLEVPMTNIAHSVIRGTLLNEREDADRQSTFLRIQGLRTDTEISWEKRKAEVVDDHPVLRVDRAVINVRLDAGTAVYDAVLPVSSATGSFENLQIRLPQGSVINREMTDRYAAANDYTVGDVNEESIVSIQFQQKTTGPVPIQLWVSQQFEGDRADFERELAGFEVLGAERQTGFLNVSIFPPEMSPRWEVIRSIRRTEGTSSSPLGTVSTAASPSTSDARFEFISQPFLLRVRVALPRTRINVKPEYRFQISRGAVVMDAQFTYTVIGAKIDVLYLQLSDSQWYCEIASNVVDVGNVDLNNFGLLTIPLISAREGTFDIQLRASRTIPTEDETWHRIVLPIPQPRVTWSESAPVAITLENYVELSPIDESYSGESDQRTTGLTRQTRRRMLESQMRIDFSEFQQEPLFYRTEPTDAEFVADVMFRRQQVDATMQTDVRLLDEFNQVTQTFHYNAAYAPAERLYFLLPRTLTTSGDVQVLLGNQVLPLRDTITSTWENVPDHLERKMVQLPEPMFQFALTFEYSLPPLVVAAEDTAPFSLSFISPLDTPVTDHRIHFFTPSGYRVELQNESRPLWESSRDPRRSSASATATFRSSQSPGRIALRVSASDKNVSGTTIVERAWLQTWLTGSFRRDQATYTVRSTHDSVSIRLPSDAVGEHPITVRVNRQQIQPNISPLDILTIPILPEQHNRPVEISIDYRFAFDMPFVEVPLILPSFGPETSVQYQYWQVILPQSRHIVGYPIGWTLEFDWTWNGLFWWRVPSVRRDDIGFAADPAVIEPPTDSSQYLFSHLQPPSYVTLYIVHRSWIVFGSSSAALLIGLLLIYVPQSRYWGSLFGLAVALLAVLFYQPPLMLLTLQAATFGVFLALGAGYIYRIFHRPNQWIPPAFPMADDVSLPSQLHSSPVATSQMVHEVVMDKESTSRDVSDTPIVNNNGQL